MCETDHLISQEVPGADDVSNLWPVAHGSTPWNARLTDELENRLNKELCAGNITLQEARARARAIGASPTVNSSASPSAWLHHLQMRRLLACAILGFTALNCLGTDAADERVTHDYYAINGAKLYVESIGHGSPVLFLHGGLMFFDNAYAKQIRYFAATHQVIGIDQRGHGHSPDGPWQLSYQMMADDTAAILQKLKVGRVDVVGHSDGANIALLLAHDHPELVRRMVVSGANLRGWSVEVMQANRNLTAMQIEEKVRRRASALPAFFVEDYSAVSPDGRDHWMTLVTKCYWLWGQPVVIDPVELKRIQAPVMVVAGDHDFTSVEETAEIFRGLPHGELFLVPGTGHGTFQTRPELVNLAVKEFLDRPDDTGDIDLH